MHGRHNMHFEVQFYGRRKNPFTGACGRRLCNVHPCSNVLEKKLKQKIKFIAQICVKILFFIFIGIIILNVHRSIRIVLLQFSGNFVFVCKLRIHSETLDKVISDLVKFLAI